MALIRPFRAFRPLAEYVAQVAARPYDVLNREEALAESNEHSFLHVSRAEIDLPTDVGPYDGQVYARAKSNFERMVAEGIFLQDQMECLYVYAQVMDGRQQIGLVALTFTDDYERDVIKKHEHTRPEKEQDRIHHIQTTRLHAEPLLMTYHHVMAINELVKMVMEQPPIYDITTNDNIQHTVWIITDTELIEDFVGWFEQRVPAIYIADGHHRAASAAKVAAAEREANPDHTGEEPYNFFLSVLFPDNQVAIMDYNRVVKDLNGLSPEEFLLRVAEHFDMAPAPPLWKPEMPHQFSLYVDGNWYALTAKPHTHHVDDPIRSLDVQILSDYLLAPILGIEDQRSDKRIDFVGGIRGPHRIETARR